MSVNNTREQKEKVHHFEWMGPHGTILLIFSLPMVVYTLYFLCNENGCLQLFPLQFPPFPNVSFFTLSGTAVFLGWMAYFVILHLVLPGQYVNGTTLANGKTLTYKVNSLSCLVITLILAFVLSFGTGLLDIGWVYDNYIPFITASIVFSYLLSIYLYISSFGKGKLLAEPGNTGYMIYDFWMGRELNPRIGSLDLKEFCELYPGLTLWVVINLAMAYRQYTLHSTVSNGMILVNIFHLIYVFDAHINEKSILTTMDITTEGFGFMLAFGDLTWVPFVYTLQARYLVTHPEPLSYPMIALILLLKIAGLYIFRGSNGQKDLYRRDPNHPDVRHLKTLQTQRPTKLLISGWWGIARHINYTGDWMMAWAWCLISGFSCIVPYFYVAYFGTLLIHREMRDEHSCRLKYGKAWDEYCRIVPYRFIPYIY